MDTTGWHASRRERDNKTLYENPQRGPDGKFEPLEQAFPVNDEFIGGFKAKGRLHAPRAASTPNFDRDRDLPPPPISALEHPVPQLDNLHIEPGAAATTVRTNGFHHKISTTTYASTQNGSQLSAVSSNGRSFITQMSAVERSKYLRAVRMTPYLQFMVGPLLRYDTVDEHGTWRGACLIVTSDASSFYDPHPTLTYEWDPHSLGSPSRISSQYPRPTASYELRPHPADPHSDAPVAAATGHMVRTDSYRSESVLGHELWVYEDTRCRTFTFWRFLIQIPLGQSEMCVRYSINGGQEMEFFVPGLGQNMRWSAYSCNGFSAGVNPDDFRGPGFDSGYDPVWMDLLRAHESVPFHVLVGGGDQIYCDGLIREPELQDWLNLPKPEQRIKHQMTPEMEAAIDRFYFNHYCRMFQSGAFARATASIPMLNMCDDHDLIDGFGSYPEDLQLSPVFNTIGKRGYFFFLLFQCFINVEVDGTDDRHGMHSNLSIILGKPGPYIPFPSHSFLSYLGPNSYILMLDCRAERRKDQVCSKYEYEKVFERLNALPSDVQHLIVQLGIPIAYPRMNFMESFLDSKLNPFVALAKRGSLKGFVNKFNGEAELLDDLNDHWTAKGHKAERNQFIQELQSLALRKQMRITFLSGDVHCAAVGVFKTYVRDKKHRDHDTHQDHRFMLNVVTSAIVNTPPPNPVITLVTNRATKIHQTLHHADTDESMIPLFTTDTDGSSPHSKFVMGRRNWCSVQFDNNTGDLRFDIRVEKEKGVGVTVGYPVVAPAPRWGAQI